MQLDRTPAVTFGPPIAYMQGMSFRPTALERAFALAKSGEYPGLSEIRTQLKAEGYATQQLEGPTLLRQLREICTSAKKAPDA